MALSLRNLSIAITLIISSFLGPGLFNQSGSKEYFFPETGHSVSGDFYSFYFQGENPLELYGYPITESFMDPATQRVVQYFQRARFEQAVDAPSGLRVRLTPIGTELYQPGEKLPIPNNGPACRYFEDSLYPVCHAFLDFFEANGGVAQFGLPISAYERHEGRVIQYFENARLEWRPDRQIGDRIVVSSLGVILFEKNQEDPVRLEPVTSSELLRVINLDAHAFTRAGVTPLKGTQWVDVLVLDQNGLAVPGAQVEMVIIYPNGEKVTQLLPVTNASGVSSADFRFSTRQPGVVTIRVNVLYNGIETHTLTSFRAWW